MDLVLFEDAMRHIARIVRVIMNSGGHALLGKELPACLPAFLPIILNLSFSPLTSPSPLSLCVTLLFLPPSLPVLSCPVLFTYTCLSYLNLTNHLQ